MRFWLLLLLLLLLWGAAAVVVVVDWFEPVNQGMGRCLMDVLDDWAPRWRSPQVGRTPAADVN